jgi:hypothetical protein
MSIHYQHTTCNINIVVMDLTTVQIVPSVARWHISAPFTDTFCSCPVSSYFLRSKNSSG